MALIEFDGELDSELPGYVEFNGNLDNEGSMGSDSELSPQNSGTQ